MFKLGVMSVLNVLPVYYGILNGSIAVPCETVPGKVTELNQKLHQGEIDLSVISSFEYARNAEFYYLLPDLSISADGPVRSIYLFLDKPIEQLDGDYIRLTAFSMTSVHLIQYLLKDHNVQYTRDANEAAVGELLIADEAIRRYYEKKDAYVYDLSSLWRDNTGLPFVFALWAVRRDSFEKNPALVHEIYKSLIKSKRDTGTLYHSMAADYHEGIFPTSEECEWYLKNLRYDLSEKYQEGFLRFQHEMMNIGKLPTIRPLVFLPPV